MGWVVSNTPRPLSPRERPGTLCAGGWVTPGPVWTGAENIAPTGIRSPDRPDRSESVYRLSYRCQVTSYIRAIYKYPFTFIGTLFTHTEVYCLIFNYPVNTWNSYSYISGRCLRTGCWGEHLGLRGTGKQESGENYIMRSLMICTHHTIL